MLVLDLVFAQSNKKIFACIASVEKLSHAERKLCDTTNNFVRGVRGKGREFHTMFAVNLAAKTIWKHRFSSNTHTHINLATHYPASKF